jgi:hypothetical protein
MASYSFHVRKADHQNPDGTFDLHVHVYRNEYQRRRLLGRYRLPGLEPIFPDEPELNQRETEELLSWMAQPAVMRKLNNCLKDTLFDTHKLAQAAPRFGTVAAEGGETYINIRIPISKRSR